MKSEIDKLHKAFESRIRLGIMSSLVVNDSMDYNGLKELLNVTDGNLASHLAALEKENFIKVKKEFVGRKTKTTYSTTASGRKVFTEHLDALENILKKHQ